MNTKDKLGTLPSPKLSANYIKVIPEITKDTAEISPNVDLASNFQTWVNISYYLFLTPFKIYRNENQCGFRVNYYQKILCGILHLLVCVYSCIRLRGTFVHKIREKPEIFLDVLSGTNEASFCLLFIHRVWFKRDMILAICNYSKTTTSNRTSNRRVVFYCGPQLIFSVLSFIFLKLDVHSSDFGIQKLLQSYRLDNYFPKNSNGTIIYDQLTGFPILGLTTLTFLSFYRWVFVDFILLIIVLASYWSYKMSSEFKELIVSEPDNEDRIIQGYFRIKDHFNKLNNFIGPLYVGVFLLTTMYCAHATITALESDVWEVSVCIVVYLCLTFIALACAAEAHYQASYFKTWLLLSRRIQRHDEYFLEVEQNNLALKGGRLFIITYWFLGKASSMILTYAIIQLQFRMTKLCVPKY